MNRPPLRRLGVSRDSLRGAAAYGLAPVIGVATAPLLAHALGVDGRGELAALMQPVTVAAAFAEAGVPAAVTRFVGQGRSPRAAMRAGYLLVLPSCLVTYAVLMAYGMVSSARHGFSFALSAVLWLSVVAGALVAVRRAAHAGRAHFDLLDAERSLTAVSRLASVVVLVVLGVTHAGWYAAGQTVLWFLCAAMLWRRPVGDRGEPVSAAEVARFSGLAMIGTIAAAANSRLDQVILPLVSTTRELGLYSVAVTVSEIPLVLGLLLARNLLTGAASGRSRSAMARSVAKVAGLVAVACAGIAALAPWGVPLVFGADFAPSVLPLVLLLPGATAGVVLLGTSSIVVGLGHPGRASLGACVAVAVVVAGLLLVPRPVLAVTSAGIATIAQVAGALVAVAVLATLRRAPVLARTG